MSNSSRPDNWINQVFRQAPWRTESQATSLILAMLVIIIVIGALYLAQASRTAAAGRRLQELEGQRQTLEQQNAQLRAEVAALRAVPRLSSDAQTAGYRPAEPDDVEYLAVPGDAPAIATEAPLPPPSEILPTYEETLGTWLARQFSALGQSIGDFFNVNFGPEKQP